MSITSNPLDPNLIKNIDLVESKDTKNASKPVPEKTTIAGKTIDDTRLDLSNDVTSVIENANTVRLRYIIDFISQLESDYRKYGNRKRKLIKVKNIFFVLDFLIGSLLIIASMALQIVGNDSKIISIIFCAVGVMSISILPIVGKFSELISNKNRNFEQLAVKKLNLCKQIFSRSISDSEISHEELLEIFECKNQYESAKAVLKTNNKKEVEDLFNRGGNVFKNNSNLSRDSVKYKIDKIVDRAIREASAPAGINNGYDILTDSQNKLNTPTSHQVVHSIDGQRQAITYGRFTILPTPNGGHITVPSSSLVIPNEYIYPPLPTPTGLNK